MGRVSSGRTPPAAVYRLSLPDEIPTPPSPRSPSPRIREPSVTTAIFTFFSRQFSRTALMLPWSLSEMKSPSGALRMRTDVS